MTYNWILIISAVVPAIILIGKVYKADKLDRESPALIRSLVFMGIISTFFALISERILSALLIRMVSRETPLYNVLLYFVVVGFSEETAKYIFMKRKTWRNREFNCQFDGVVYAVTVSLGFALWENISYVMIYGFGTALVRAVTAVPGHACFGVFMGIFYGQAKRYDYLRRPVASRFCRIMALIVPALIHGAYDYIASMGVKNSGWYFLIFVAVLFIVSYSMVVNASRKDRRIDRHYSKFEIID